MYAFKSCVGHGQPVSIKHFKSMSSQGCGPICIFRQPRVAGPHASGWTLCKSGGGEKKTGRLVVGERGMGGISNERMKKTTKMRHFCAVKRPKSDHCFTQVKVGNQEVLHSHLDIEKSPVLSRTLESKTRSASPGSEIGGSDEGDTEHIIRSCQLRSGTCGARARQELLSCITLLCGAFLKILSESILPSANGSQRTLNTARPTMIPSAKKMNATINQITPQTVEWIRLYNSSNARTHSPRDGQQPQISANALASELLTLRRMVSSSRYVSQTL
jgi:hypothetical protein